MTQEEATALHNDAGAEIAAIFQRVILARSNDGAGGAAAFVLLESIALYVFLSCVRDGGDDDVLRRWEESFRARLAEKRLELRHRVLLQQPPVGSA